MQKATFKFHTNETNSEFYWGKFKLYLTM